MGCKGTSGNWKLQAGPHSLPEPWPTSSLRAGWCQCTLFDVRIWQCLLKVKSMECYYSWTTRAWCPFLCCLQMKGKIFPRWCFSPTFCTASDNCTHRFQTLEKFTSKNLGADISIFLGWLRRFLKWNLCCCDKMGGCSHLSVHGYTLNSFKLVLKCHPRTVFPDLPVWNRKPFP